MLVEKVGAPVGNHVFIADVMDRKVLEVSSLSLSFSLFL
jgi:hypothetical protein